MEKAAIVEEKLLWKRLLLLKKKLLWKRLLLLRKRLLRKRLIRKRLLRSCKRKLKRKGLLLLLLMDVVCMPDKGHDIIDGLLVELLEEVVINMGHHGAQPLAQD